MKRKDKAVSAIKNNDFQKNMLDKNNYSLKEYFSIE